MSRSVAIIMMLLLYCVSFSKDTQLYGPVPEADYVSGRFDPSKHPLFVNLSQYGIPSRDGSFLRKETVSALKKMLSGFKREYPEIKIWVRSSTRNFNIQKYIWESKWKGRRTVEGKNLHFVKDPLKKAYIILRYSSMPGTSRHHWGTDFDINSLNNGYYEKGKGKLIYEWLKKNAARYGFCQPYTSGRKKGYLEEKWHWSYVPLAAKFVRTWNSHYKLNTRFFIGSSGFSGSGVVSDIAPVFVNTVNPRCLRLDFATVLP